MGDERTRWVRLPEHVRAAAASNDGSILLETSRFDPCNEHSYLFQNPVNVISANTLDQIEQVFSGMEEALANGFYVAGFFSYECGGHFGRFAGVDPGSQELPLAWLGVYEKPLIFDHAQGRFQGGNPVQTQPPERGQRKNTAPLSDHVALGIARDAYCASVQRIKEYIAAGDTYQVNFTDQVSLRTQIPASVVFDSLLKHQSVAYGAWMHVAGHHILSFSPELFFRTDGRRIVTRPMKGTMPRGLDANEDSQAALRLQNDEKNRSEHVMIVDMLRNDLGRICAMGSVQVEDIFSVERYETLLQMTSTISGTLRPGIRYYDIFRSMFPSGSITGAPKIRTMQIIRELERNPRGIYTGAIGFASPNGQSVFNVAIRTLVMKDGDVRMGVGGGIVADSDPGDEHRECLLKAAFLTRAHHDFQLVETMLWEKNFCFLSMHLDRLESSASYFNFVFDRKTVLSRLGDAADSFAPDGRYRVRLRLASSGDIALDSSKLVAEPLIGRVRLSPEHTSSADVFLRHKTTRREMYDRLHAEARADGFDEVLFTNEKGEVTEGSISNIFIERSGKLLTPPLACGVLPGIFRRHLLETCATAEVSVLTVEDLRTSDAVLLCNSVRGIRRVESLCLNVPAS
ncbi:MAG: aminodeoxychorismate synthase component I [Acidobacteriaceae bacterium]